MRLKPTIRDKVSHEIKVCYEIYTLEPLVPLDQQQLVEPCETFNLCHNLVNCDRFAKYAKYPWCQIFTDVVVLNTKL